MRDLGAVNPARKDEALEKEVVYCDDYWFVKYSKWLERAYQWNFYRRLRNGARPGRTIISEKRRDEKAMGIAQSKSCYNLF